MVLIALAILFAGLGFASLAGSDSEETTTASVTTTITTTTTTSTTTPESADARSVSVQVFNNSDVTGLAAETATRLTDLGWTVSETGNFSDSDISETTVYYGTSAAEQEAATEIAAQLGVSAAPRIPGIEDLSPGVIVIVTTG